MTTAEFNLWAARFLVRLEQAKADLSARIVLERQRAACADVAREGAE